MATRGRHRHAPGIMHACVYLYIQLAIPTYLAATGMMGGKAGRLNQNVWGRGSVCIYTGAHCANLVIAIYRYLSRAISILCQFDWRKGPLQWLRPGDTYDQLKARIESFSSRNGNEPVVALSISMGGPFFSLFLAKHTERAWRRRFIRRFVSVCGPYGTCTRTCTCIMHSFNLSLICTRSGSSRPLAV